MMRGGALRFQYSDLLKKGDEAVRWVAAMHQSPRRAPRGGGLCVWCSGGASNRCVTFRRVDYVAQ